MPVIVGEIDAVVEAPPTTQAAPAAEGAGREEQPVTVLDRLHEAYALADRQERLKVE
jgi:hypothetical protein